MPTICSMCGGTYGHCESCRKADAMIMQHENPAARAALTATLHSFAVPQTSTTGTQSQAVDETSTYTPPDESTAT